MLPKAETVKLTRDNWAIWARSTENTLEKMGLVHAIRQDCRGYWQDNDAWSYIVSTLGPDYSHVVDITVMDTAYTLWRHLIDMFTTLARPKVLVYGEELRNLRMKSGENPSKYVARAVSIVNAMRNLGEPYSTLALANTILEGLTPEYERDAETLAPGMAKHADIYLIENTLLVRYHKLQKKKLSSESARPSRSQAPSPRPFLPRLKVGEANAAMSPGGSAGNTPKAGNSPKGPFVAQQTKGRLNSGSDDNCYYCGQQGHIKPHCLKRLFDEAVDKGSFDGSSFLRAQPIV